MKTVSAALKAHLALPTQTMCTCWLARLANGDVYGFTDHDEEIVISGWSSPDNILHATYAADSGFSTRAIQTSDALNVDNTEAQGIVIAGDDLLTSPSITEDDLRAGFWNFARVYIFEVNYRDLTMGPLYKRVGWLGEVTAGRLHFRAEIRGLMQLYTRTIISLTSPGCRVKTLGDAMCKLDLDGSPSYRFTGAVDSVNADNQTFQCATLTQPGPSAGVAITNITNANPGVVTLADASLNLVAAQVVSLSDVQGMITINGNVIVRNPSGNTFELDFDTTNTTDFPPYTSGGTAIQLGAGSGYFEYGVVEWLTGANEGISMEVKAYVPGQVTLVLPMPFAISGASDSPTDTFRITAGCDRSFTTCGTRFSNTDNFRGEPYVQGLDRMVQVGRGGTE